MFFTSRDKREIRQQIEDAKKEIRSEIYGAVKEWKEALDALRNRVQNDETEAERKNLRYQDRMKSILEDIIRLQETKEDKDLSGENASEDKTREALEKIKRELDAVKEAQSQDREQRLRNSLEEGRRLAIFGDRLRSIYTMLASSQPKAEPAEKPGPITLDEIDASNAEYEKLTCQAAPKQDGGRNELPLFREIDTLEQYQRWKRAAKELQVVVWGVREPEGNVPPAEDKNAWVEGRGELERVALNRAPRFLAFLEGRPGERSRFSNWLGWCAFREKVRRVRRSDSKRLHRYVLDDLRTVLAAIETHITRNPDRFREFTETKTC